MNFLKLTGPESFILKSYLTNHNTLNMEAISLFFFQKSLKIIYRGDNLILKSHQW